MSLFDAFPLSVADKPLCNPWIDSLTDATHPSFEAADSRPSNAFENQPIRPSLGQTIADVYRRAAACYNSRFQLPRNGDRFTGRETLLREMVTRLNHPGPLTDSPARVILLTGSAGAGKSALALRVAHQLKAHFPQGQLYVNWRAEVATHQALAAPQRDCPAAAVLDRWLRALGLKASEMPHTLADKVERYHRLLQNQQILVVVDNADNDCLDPADFAAQIRALLPPAERLDSGAAALITSRQPLQGLGGGQVYPLAPLSQTEALALLARFIAPIRIAAAPAAAADLVERCGGLPQAIRLIGGVLAAQPEWTIAQECLSRLQALEAQQWSARQADALTGLASPLSEATAKQWIDPLQVSFQLSYEQLRPSEQQLLAMLAQMPGPFSAEITAASGLEIEELAASLERLLEAQLLDNPSERYYLCPLRAYVLTEQPLALQARRQLFATYADSAHYWAKAFDPNQRPALAAQFLPEASPLAREQSFLQTAIAWFEAERPNLLLALNWGHHSAQQQLAAEIMSFASDLTLFYRQGDYWQDWEHSQRIAIAAAKAIGDRAGEGQLRNNLGLCYRAQKDWPSAIAEYTISLDIKRNLADRLGESQTRNNLGVVYRSQGQWAAAIEQYQASLALKQALGDLTGQGRTLTNLGLVYHAQGQWDEAIHHYQASLKIKRQLGDGLGESKLLEKLAAIYQAQGHSEEAISRYEASLMQQRTLRDRRSESQTLENLGLIYQAQGRLNEAIDRYEESLNIRHTLGDRYGEGQILRNLGNLYQARRDWPKALECYRRSLAVYQALGDRMGESQALECLGVVHQAQGHWQQAIEQYQAALEIYRTIGDLHGEGTILNNLGIVYQGQGQWEKAITHYQKSLERKRILGDRAGEGNSLLGLGNVYYAMGSWSEAIAHYQASLLIKQALSDVQGEGQALNNLGNAYDASGQSSEAIAQYKASLAIRRSLGDRSGEANTLCNLGNVLAAQQRWPEAMARYRASLTLYQTLGNLASVAQVQGQMGKLSQAQGRWPEAIESYRASLENYQAAKDRSGESQAHHCLALAFQAQRQWQQALAHHQTHRTLTQQLGDRAAESRALNNLGTVYQAQGQWAQALEVYQASLTLKQALDDCPGVARTQANLGRLLAQQQRWSEAIAQYQASLDSYRKLGDRPGEALALQGLAEVYQAQARWAEAAIHYEASLALISAGSKAGSIESSEVLANYPRAGKIHHSLGLTYQALGRWAEAIEQYQADLLWCRQSGDRTGESRTLNNLGTVYQAQSHWAEAIAQYEASLALKRTLEDAHSEGITLKNLGYVWAAQVQFPRAIDYWQQALTKLDPESSEAHQVAQKLKNPAALSWQQALLGGLSQLAILALAGLTLLRGHRLLGGLILGAWASFLVYRVWQRRRTQRWLRPAPLADSPLSAAPCQQTSALTSERRAKGEAEARLEIEPPIR